MPVGPIGGPQGTQGQVNKIQQDAAAGDFSMPDTGSADTEYYMRLMAEMQAEARAFTAFTQILTARHDAAMSAVRNLK